VTAKEMLDRAPAKMLIEAEVDANEKTAPPQVLQINLGKQPAARLASGDEQRPAWRLQTRQDSQFTLLDAENAIVVFGTLERLQPDVQTSADFLASQLASALGERQSMPRADVESDVLLGGVSVLFDHADRNQDAQLTVAELQAYFALVELRLASQVHVRLVYHGHNVFPWLDLNSDGGLSVTELSAAVDLAADDEESPLPRVYRLEIGSLPARTWGGVTIAAPKPALRTQDEPAGPPWFTALDRNRDSVVSRREFLGPPPAFQSLDVNRNGLLELAEAIAGDEVAP
jgi:hypothetical protein